MKNNLKKGFALLYAVLVVGVMMSLVFGVLNIVYKQIALSGVNRNSVMSFYAADSGLECGRYWSAYGAFNPANPAVASQADTFSTIDCLGTSITCADGTDNNGNTCAFNSSDTSGSGVIANPLVGTNSFDYDLFTYSLAPAYIGTPYAPQASVNVWQDPEFAPAGGDLSTAILSTGINTTANSPEQVQRGAGETAGITQCLAPAFTYQLNGGGQYPSNWGNGEDFAEAIAPYFPGESISGLANKFPDSLGINKTGGAPLFPYIAYQNPDNWSFAPSSPTDLSLSAVFLPGINSSSSYAFGYYTGSIASDYSNFFPLIGPGLVVPLSIPANTSGVHFGLEQLDSDGNVIDFWSTNVNDDTNDKTYGHVIVVATPLPSIINTNTADGSGYTRLGGKYVFGFDTTDSQPQSPTFTNIVVLVQLVGCP